MSTPFFSIVIPSFNSARFIKTTLESALAQTFADLEVIVVDENSHDGTADVIQAFASADPRVIFVEQTGEKGPARARNQGLELARGRYVTFLDSDNILLPRACEIVRETITRQGREHDVYFAGIRYFETDRPNHFLTFTVQRIEHVTLEAVIRQNFINLLGSFIKREVVARLGGFDNRFRTCEEHILWLRLLLWSNATFCHIPHVLGHLRFHVNNLTWRASYLIEAAETNFVIFDWLEKEISESRPEARDSLMPVLRSERVRWLFRAMLGGLVVKMRAVAQHYLSQWCDAAGKPPLVRGVAVVIINLTPLTIASPLMMFLRRRYVMRRYVPVGSDHQ